MKKSILLLLIQIMTCQAFSNQSSHETVGAAAKQGRKNTAVVAWSIAGVSLLITIGIVTAIAIQNEK